MIKLKKNTIINAVDYVGWEETELTSFKSNLF